MPKKLSDNGTKMVNLLHNFSVGKNRRYMYRGFFPKALEARLVSVAAACGEAAVDDLLKRVDVLGTCSECRHVDEARFGAARRVHEAFSQHDIEVVEGFQAIG